jgi:hypothetical protein
MNPFLNNDLASLDFRISVLFLLCILDEHLLIVDSGFFLGRGVHVVLGNGLLFGSIGEEIDRERRSESRVFGHEFFDIILFKVFQCVLLQDQPVDKVSSKSPLYKEECANARDLSSSSESISSRILVHLKAGLVTARGEDMLYRIGVCGGGWGKRGYIDLIGDEEGGVKS